MGQGLVGCQEWHGKGLDIHNEKEESVPFDQCMFDRYARNWLLNSLNIVEVVEHCIITHQKLGAKHSVSNYGFILGLEKNIKILRELVHRSNLPPLLHS